MMSIPVLKTPRLILRAFGEEDFSAVQAYAGNAENTVFTFWGPNDEAATHEFLREAVRDAEALPCRNYQYAVTLGESGRLIGSGNLGLEGEDEGEIGWIIHRDCWGQGYGTEVGKALLALAFDSLGLRRILSHCDADNTASWRIMEKLGMRREGHFIEGRPAPRGSGKKYSDEYVYAILRREWDAAKER